MRLKKVGSTITLVVMASLALGIGPAAAQSEVCPGMDSGKIDTTGEPASVTVTAPAGFLIDAYCVKAGSEESAAGVEFVNLSPPQATVTISHSSGKAVSHYSYSLVEETPPTTPPPTTPPPTTPATQTSPDTPPSETSAESPTGAKVLGATAGGGASAGGGGDQVTVVPAGGVETGGGSTAGMEAKGLFGLGVLLLVAAGAVYVIRRRIRQTT